MTTPKRFTITVEVRFRDVDVLGHVNNAVYLTYMESARMAWWFQVTRQRDLRDIGVILARAEVDFRSPASYGDLLDVGVACASIGRSSFTLELDVADHRTRRLVAEGRAVMVRFDYAANRSVPISDELRQLILAQDPDARRG
jgi:acyl-CoA thioester hydrolase